AYRRYAEAGNSKCFFLSFPRPLGAAPVRGAGAIALGAGAIALVLGAIALDLGAIALGAGATALGAVRYAAGLSAGSPLSSGRAAPAPGRACGGGAYFPCP
ncbi:MAG: hypothetical protein LBJ24_07860, partial [Treponema sp.]|nr:hypothetical protein [Treponema sp.]